MILQLPVIDWIVALGKHLGFQVAKEVEASESAWVDVVWFDPRIKGALLGRKKPKMRFSPVLPVYGFEVELKTGLNAKHIKGSVSNLDTLGAQVGVIVIGSGNITQVQKTTKSFATMSTTEVEKELIQRAYKWVYAEAQPKTRIVVMSEEQVLAWAKGAEVAL